MTKSPTSIKKLLRALNWRSNWRSSAIITSLIVLLVGGIQQLGHLEFLELALFDLMMRSRLETRVDERVTVVGIEESDLQTWQQSTFSDLLLARLLAKLQRHNPAVIGLDIYRDLPQPPGNRELHQELAAENVIVIRSLGPGDGVDAPPNVPATRVGFNNFVLDHDGKVRRNLMALPTKKQPLYSFATRVSAVFLAAQDCLSLSSQFLNFKQRSFPHMNSTFGGYQLDKSEIHGSQILINYRSPEQAARRLSFSQIFQDDFDPDWINGKAIIIGYTAPSKKDLFSTPLGVDKIPGVVIHAHLVSQILGAVSSDEENLFRSWPQWSEYLWMCFWSAAGAGLVWHIGHPLRLVSGVVIAVSGLCGISLLCLLNTLWIPLTPALAGLLLNTGVMLAYKTFYSSVVDELTGLANRKYFVSLLYQGVLKSGSEMAVLSINIARFRTIRDSLGHGVSDRLLIAVSKRIQECIRHQDKLARTGVAEFSLVLLALNDQDYALVVAQRIQNALSKSFMVKGEEIIITTDLGIAFPPTGDAISGEELLRNCNLAQERAQIMGKNQYVIYSPKMHSETLAQWELESDLRHAIANQEFQLHYQPIVDLRTASLAGFEALVRWISPARGFVSPGEFIPLAESSGLIIPLGSWILGEACQQMHQWQKQFNISDLVISINLSSYQFQADLVEQVQQILSIKQLPPHCLKLEITESAMMENVEDAIALLHQLKALGIKLSIDDFGTGYSSLSYLQQFCADTLKVDQSFVRTLESSPKNKAIIDIIITLAHKLEMDVVAEGIETATHRDILKSLDCEYGQGYWFAKPLNREDATEYIHQQIANRQSPIKRD